MSDTHLRHEKVEVPEGDVLIFAGDMCLSGRDVGEVRWFAKWFAGQPHAHKLAVAGNHDWPFERTATIAEAEAALRERGIVYLEDSGYEINGLRFWGSPWQPQFMSWAFNLPRGAALAEKWDLIPGDTHVLITHSPPRGMLDPGFGEAHVGCDALRSQVENRIRPRLHVFGHCHSGHGQVTWAGTTYVNATVVDEAYQPVYAPIVFEI